ncbi:hypothetical protein NDU88_001610, partial [Pleurodeles waltl]
KKAEHGQSHGRKRNSQDDICYSVIRKHLLEYKTHQRVPVCGANSQDSEN